MPHYALVYLGGNPSKTPAADKQHFAEYQQWLAHLGDAAISPANPLKNTHTINHNGEVSSGSTTTMSGYTIIAADSMQAALSIAQSCPFLDIGGSLEVSELAQMPTQH